MSVVRNHFNTTLSDISSSTMYIRGLTGEGSSASCTYGRAEATRYFQDALYQTLVDAGYTGVTVDYSANTFNILGLKVGIAVRSSSSSSSYVGPAVWFSGGSANRISHGGSTTKSINLTGGVDLDFDIIVRGDGENSVCITYTSASTPDTEYYLAMITKAVNTVTQEDALFATADSPTLSSTDEYFAFNKSDIYTSYTELLSDSNCFYGNVGFNTTTEMAIIPAMFYRGSFYMPYMPSSHPGITEGKYYLIGDYIYYAYGIRPLLVKVS